MDGKPIEVATPTCGPDELLVRHDAVGLCFSDIKVIKAGETHPRLAGRNMQSNPVVLGHEVALTVVEVGENLRDQYKPATASSSRPTSITRAWAYAYGYALQGGLSQYNVIGEEILDGDEGCYLLPVQPETGYAEAALTEPWACVDGLLRRRSIAPAGRPGGVVLVAGGPAADADYTLGTPYAGGQPPARVIALRRARRRCWASCSAGASATASRHRAGAPSAELWPRLEALPAQAASTTSCSWAPTPRCIERWSRRRPRAACLNLVGAAALDRRGPGRRRAACTMTTSSLTGTDERRHRRGL